MAGRVGDDEAALRSGEVAMRNIDSDALLALGTQAIGEQREVGLAIAIAAAGLHHGSKLVFEDRLRVVQQATNEGALAVVNRASGGDAKGAP